MPLLFVYGSLKRGFANEHVNTGRCRPGRYGTRQPVAMYLLGDGEVPCIVLGASEGTQVIGEVYEVDGPALEAMDRLERLGEPQGYERVVLELERIDDDASATLHAFAYVKRAERVPPDVPRIGPLAEYTPAHAARFAW